MLSKVFHVQIATGSFRKPDEIVARIGDGKTNAWPVNEMANQAGSIRARERWRET
jgi:hypothetical protein